MFSLAGGLASRRNEVFAGGTTMSTMEYLPSPMAFFEEAVEFDG